MSIWDSRETQTNMEWPLHDTYYIKLIFIARSSHWRHFYGFNLLMNWLQAPLIVKFHLFPNTVNNDRKNANFYDIVGCAGMCWNSFSERLFCSKTNFTSFLFWLFEKVAMCAHVVMQGGGWSCQYRIRIYLPVFCDKDWQAAIGLADNLLSPKRITKSARHRHNSECIRIPWDGQKSVVAEPCRIDVIWTLTFTTKRNFCFLPQTSI